MPVLVGDSVELQWIGSCFAQTIRMNLTYRCAVQNVGRTTGQTLQELLTTVNGAGANAITPQYLACLPPQYSLLETRAQVIRPTRSAYTSQVFVGGTPGTHASPATVANDSAAVTRRTALAGRRQVSTLKVGPVPDAVSAAGLLVAAYKVLLEAFAGRTTITILNPVGTEQFIPTILTATGFPDGRDLETFRIGDQSRVQRRRTVGLGE